MREIEQIEQTDLSNCIIVLVSKEEQKGQMEEDSHFEQQISVADSSLATKDLESPLVNQYLIDYDEFESKMIMKAFTNLNIMELLLL